MGRTSDARRRARQRRAIRFRMPPVTWAMNQPQAASISPDGRHRKRPGDHPRHRASGSVTGEAAIQSIPSRVEVTPSSADLESGQQMRFRPLPTTPTASRSPASRSPGRSPTSGKADRRSAASTTPAWSRDRRRRRLGLGHVQLQRDLSRPAAAMGGLLAGHDFGAQGLRAAQALFDSGADAAELDAAPAAVDDLEHRRRAACSSTPRWAGWPMRS